MRLGTLSRRFATKRRGRWCEVGGSACRIENGEHTLGPPTCRAETKNCYSFFWLTCTTARPPLSTFRLTAPLPDAGLSKPNVRRATVSIFSTCELRNRISSASIDSK